MLKQIIDFLNLRLGTLNYFEQLFCLCEIKGESNSDLKQPMQRVLQGEWVKVNFDEYNGVSYWRLRDDITTTEVTSLVAGKKRLSRTFPLRLVVAVPREKVTVDDAYSFERLAVSIEKVVTVQLGDLQTQIGAGRVVIEVNSEKADAKSVWDQETDNTQTYEPKFELLYGALDVTVTVTADVACFVSECDNPDTDILHTFDFCKPATRERLTAEQVACLEAALCETPPTLCEQLADIAPENVVADVFDCLTPEAQDALLEAECPTCDPLTINFDGELLQTISDPCGQTVELSCSTQVYAAYVEDGGSITGLYVPNGTANGKPVFAKDPTHYLQYTGTRWELVTNGPNHLANVGNEDYPWQATWTGLAVTQATIAEYCSDCDPCADATANLFNTVPTLISSTPIASGASANITAPNATAVLKDTAGVTLSTTAIPSNVSQNITAPDGTVLLDGAAYGSVVSGGSINVNSQSYSRLPSKTWRFCYADRGLISGYTGALMQCRKATGGSTFDAVQDANGYMDTAAVVTARGNDNITTPIVYDQAGSGINLLQAVVANQPRLAVGSPNGKDKATIYHAQTPFMQAAHSFALNSTETIYVVCRPNTINGAIVCGSGTSWWLEMAGSNTVYVYNGFSYFATTGAVQLYSPCLLTLQLKLNALIVRINGVQILSQNPFALAASTSVTVGARPTGANPNNLGWQALLAHAGDFDASVESALMAAYKL